MAAQKQAQSLGDRVDNVFNMIRNAADPSAVLMGLVQRNPRYSRAIEQARQYGSTPTEAFYAIAKQKGLSDPDAYLAQIRSRLGR